MADDPLALTELLANPFWVRGEPLGRDTKGNPIIRPGQLVIAHHVYPPTDPLIIEVRNYDPRDESKNEYAITQFRPGATPAPHFPIKSLGLTAEEQLYVLRGKRRPGVVLQTVSTDYYNQLYPEHYVWMAPAFTFKRKHTLEYRCEVAAFKKDHLFYLPSETHGLAERSVLRFEHIQPVASAGVEPIFADGMQVFLSAEAWTILQHRLYRFCTGKVLDAGIEETITIYGEYIFSAFKEASKA